MVPKQNQPQFKNTLTASFFEKYYHLKRMNYREITEMLNEKGIKIAKSTVKKYGHKLGFGRNIQECKGTLNWSVSYMDELMLEKIDGFLLGDGHISENGALSASLKYKDFRGYLASLFVDYNPVYSKYFLKEKEYYRFCSKVHPDLKRQRKRWYPYNKKSVPKDIRISPLSVLIWYLGDGKFEKGNIFLYTNSFQSFEVNFLVNIFHKLNIKCQLYWAHKQGSHKKDYPLIYISSKDSPSFFEFIGIESPVKCYDRKFCVPYWFPGSIRISQLASIYKIPASKVRYIVSNLEKNNSPYIKRITPKGRIWIVKDGILKVAKHATELSRLS